MKREDIMSWYKESEHEIIISQNNKSNIYTGVVIANDGHTYKSSGDDMCGVLDDLKNMLGGSYKKD